MRILGIYTLCYIQKLSRIAQLMFVNNQKIIFYIELYQTVDARHYRVTWIFLWRLPTQNHLKLFITEKRRNKSKYLSWNSIRLKFVKKTSMPNPVKSLGYIKCYSSSSPRPVKSHINFIRYKFQKIWSWLRRAKVYWKLGKLPHFTRWSTTYYLQVFKKRY